MRVRAQSTASRPTSTQNRKPSRSVQIPRSADLASLAKVYWLGVVRMVCADRCLHALPRNRPKLLSPRSSPASWPRRRESRWRRRPVNSPSGPNAARACLRIRGAGPALPVRRRNCAVGRPAIALLIFAAPRLPRHFRRHLLKMAAQSLHVETHAARLTYIDRVAYARRLRARHPLSPSMTAAIHDRPPCAVPLRSAPDGATSHAPQARHAPLLLAHAVRAVRTATGVDARARSAPPPVSSRSESASCAAAF